MPTKTRQPLRAALGSVRTHRCVSKIGVSVALLAILLLLASILETPLISIIVPLLVIGAFHLMTIGKMHTMFGQVAYILVAIFAFGLLVYQIEFGNIPMTGVDWVRFEFHASAILSASDVAERLVEGPENAFPKIVAVIYVLLERHLALVFLFVHAFWVVSLHFVQRLTLALGLTNEVADSAAVGYMILPINLVFSVSYLRESLNQLLFAACLLLFVGYVQNRSASRLIGSFVLAAANALLHSGMVAVLAVFLLFSILYDRGSGRISRNPYRVGMALVILLAVLWSLIGSPFMEKFGDLSGESVLEAGQASRGNTTYVTRTPENFLEMVLLTPYRMVMLLTAPLPWQVYDFSTALALLLSAVPQWILLWGVGRYFRRGSVESLDPALRVLFVALVIACTFAFSWGVSNYGTAMRHRMKWSAAVVILATLGLKREGRRARRRRRGALNWSSVRATEVYPGTE